RRLLGASEVALSAVLLVGGGLLVRSFRELQHVDPGFRADRILTFRLGLPGARYADLDATVASARRLEERLRALPGVESVGAASALPFDDLPNWSSPYVVEGTEGARGSREADARAVRPGWFATAG